jgi:hypothetical protein
MVVVKVVPSPVVVVSIGGAVCSSSAAKQAYALLLLSGDLCSRKDLSN